MDEKPPDDTNHRDFPTGSPGSWQLSRGLRRPKRGRSSWSSCRSKNCGLMWVYIYIYIGLYGIKWDLYGTKTKKTPMKLVSLNRIRYGLVPGLNGTVDNELLLLVHRNLVEVYTVMWISTCTSWDVDGILMNRYRFMWTGTRWLSWDTANDLHFRHISGWFDT